MRRAIQSGSITSRLRAIRKEQLIVASRTHRLDRRFVRPHVFDYLGRTTKRRDGHADPSPLAALRLMIAPPCGPAQQENFPGCASSAPFSRLADHSGRGVSDAGTDANSYSDDNDHKSGLRPNRQHGVLDFPISVSPAVKSVEGPKGLVWEMAVHELERVREDRPYRTEQNSPMACRRIKKKYCDEDAEEAVGTDRQRIPEKGTIECHRRADPDESRPDPIISVRDCIQGKVTGEANRKCSYRMRRHQTGKSRAHYGMGT